MAGTGGFRPGAGRKSNKVRAAAREFCCDYFGPEHQKRQWQSLLASEDERIRLDAAKYLTDRMYGKPAQQGELKVSGDLELIKRVVADL